MTCKVINNTTVLNTLLCYNKTQGHFKAKLHFLPLSCVLTESLGMSAHENEKKNGYSSSPITDA